MSALANIYRLKLNKSTKAFFDWWGRELRMLVPPAIENWFGDSADFMLVRIDENQASFYWCSDSSHKLLGNYGLDDHYGHSGDSKDNSELDAESLRQIISEHVSENTRVDVELARDRVLRSEVFLPLATEPTLREVVRFEMDRFTPFKVGEVGFSCTVIERIPERDKLKLELHVVRRDYLAELLASLATLGLRVTGAYVQVDDQDPADKHVALVTASHGNFA